MFNLKCAQSLLCQLMCKVKHCIIHIDCYAYGLYAEHFARKIIKQIFVNLRCLSWLVALPVIGQMNLSLSSVVVHSQRNAAPPKLFVYFYQTFTQVHVVHLQEIR